MTIRSEKPMTLCKIAELAGTSASTVSRVLSNDVRISPSTRARVLAVVEKNHYQPNQFARILKGGHTGMIGVLSSSIGSGFFAEVLRGIDLISKSNGMHLMCSFAHGTVDYINLCRDMMTGGRVDGVILIDPPMELYDEPLSSRNVPVVLCASRAIRSESPWRKHASVTVNSRQVMKDIIEHLVSQGCRRVVHLAGPLNTYDSQARRTAFRETVSRYRMLKTEVIDGHLISEDGYRTSGDVMRDDDKLPDAFVCFNDSTAQGVLTFIRESPSLFRRPTRVTGWDNSAAASFLQLTSVAMPMIELGEEAARLLLEYKSKDTPVRGKRRDVLLSARVIYRASTQFIPEGEAKPSGFVPAEFSATSLRNVI